MSAMGNALPMYDSAATSIRLLQKSSRGSIWANVMMLGMRASVSGKLGPTSSERNVQKGPDVLLLTFGMGREFKFPHISHSLMVSWHVLRCRPIGIPGFDPQCLIFF